MRRIQQEGRGVVLYVGQPDAGLGAFLNRFQFAAKTGKDIRREPPKKNFRDYGIGAQILVSLGLRRIRLLAGHSRHVVALEGYNLEIVEQIELK